MKSFLNLRKIMLNKPGYKPDILLDVVMEKLGLKNDAALSIALDVAPPVISKVRHKKLAIGSTMLLRMHELTGISFKELRSLMVDRRTNTHAAGMTNFSCCEVGDAA